MFVLFNLIKEKTTNNSLALIPIIPISLALLILMPVNHLIKDYHYHDRKGNYAAWDYGYNLLNSCEPYSVLFTKYELLDLLLFSFKYSKVVTKLFILISVEKFS